MLISRIWHGAVPARLGDAFARHLDDTGVREARSTAGNTGAYVRRVDAVGYAHFFLCTLWESWPAIRAFAGERPEIPVSYPDDQAYELISDPIVAHQEVSAAANPFVIA